MSLYLDDIWLFTVFGVLFAYKHKFMACFACCQLACEYDMCLVQQVAAHITVHVFVGVSFDKLALTS